MLYLEKVVLCLQCYISILVMLFSRVADMITLINYLAMMNFFICTLLQTGLTLCLYLIYSCVYYIN
jgi:hypothetical protein